MIFGMYSTYVTSNTPTFPFMYITNTEIYYVAIKEQLNYTLSTI